MGFKGRARGKGASLRKKPKKKRGLSAHHTVKSLLETLPPDVRASVPVGRNGVVKLSDAIQAFESKAVAARPAPKPAPKPAPSTPLKKVRKAMSDDESAEKVQAIAQQSSPSTKVALQKLARKAARTDQLIKSNKRLSTQTSRAATTLKKAKNMTFAELLTPMKSRMSETAKIQACALATHVVKEALGADIDVTFSRGEDVLMVDSKAVPLPAAPMPSSVPFVSKPVQNLASILGLYFCCLLCNLSCQSCLYDDHT